MKQLWTTLITTMKARMLRLLTVFQRFRNPSYILQRIVMRLRQIFNRLIDIRPKHKKD